MVKGSQKIGLQSLKRPAVVMIISLDRQHRQQPQLKIRVVLAAIQMMVAIKLLVLANVATREC